MAVFARWKYTRCTRCGSSARGNRRGICTLCRRKMTVSGRSPAKKSRSHSGGSWWADLLPDFLLDLFD